MRENFESAIFLEMCVDSVAVVFDNFLADVALKRSGLCLTTSVPATENYQYKNFKKF
jgi:hypothetical protein